MLAEALVVGIESSFDMVVVETALTMLEAQVIGTASDTTCKSGDARCRFRMDCGLHRRTLRHRTEVTLTQRDTTGETRRNERNMYTYVTAGSHGREG